MIRISLGARLMPVLLLLGCGEGALPTGDSSESVGRTGFALIVDGDSTIAAGFEVTVNLCGKTANAAPVIIPLEEFTIPGGIAQFEDRPFAEQSAHAFGDYFVSVEVGCYDVTIAPVDDAGLRVETCSEAHATDVIVEPESTTEIVLVSQCGGPAQGGLDIAGAINHRPIIETFMHDKFAARCEVVTTCAIAYDPDNDPIEFAWEVPSGIETQFTDGQYIFDGAIIDRQGDVCMLGPSEGVTQLENGRWQSCITLSSETSTTVNLALRVYDLRYDAEGPADDPPQVLHYGPEGAEALPDGWRTAQRLEDYIAAQEGYTPESLPQGLWSHDARYFPFFVSTASECEPDHESPDPYCVEPSYVVVFTDRNAVF